MAEEPDLITILEFSVWDWGTNSPGDCLDGFDEEPSDITIQREIQYHLGAYTEAAMTLNAAYSNLGIDKKRVPMDPPWMKHLPEGWL